MKFWVVGQWTNEGNHQWAIEGVFDNQEKAESICKTSKFFVGPVILNEQLAPNQVVEWPGAYYPVAVA